MNALTKRLILCFCGGVIGALLALEFGNNPLLVAGITLCMGVVGWISADVSGFVYAVKLAALEVGKIHFRDSASKHLHRICQVSRERFSCWVFAFKMEMCKSVLTTICLLQICLLLCLWGALKVGYGLEFLGYVFLFIPAGISLHLAFVVMDLVKALIGDPIFSKNVNPRDVWLRDKASTLNDIRHLMPWWWVPTLVLGFIRSLAWILTKLAEIVPVFVLLAVKFAHTDIRVVYASCFMFGTIGGFWVGKMTGIPLGGIAGGLISLGIAWLDWKVLSLKFGWRQAT